LNNILKLVAVLAFAVACVLFPISIFGVNDYLALGIVRVLFTGFGIALMFVFGFKRHLLMRNKDQNNASNFKQKQPTNILHSTLIVIVIFLVSIFNFPFASFISEQATLEATAREVFTYLFLNASVALFEEVFFRGLVLLLLFELFQTIKSKKEIDSTTTVRHSLFTVHLPILIGAVLFSFLHLFSLDLMQLGYTFLLGLIWGYLVFVTKNIWLAIIAHFIFNLGGTIISMLGSGVFFTTFQIVITAIVGLICGVTLVVIESRRIRKLKITTTDT